MTSIPYIASPSAITFYLDWQPYSFSSDAIEYEQALRILNDPATSDEDKRLSLLELTDMRVEAHAKRWDRIKSLSPDIDVTDDDRILWKGVELHGTMAQRLLKLNAEGLDTTPMVNFISKLQQNPSYRVVESLYDFLEVGQIPITSDGDFLAYKAVADDWFSIASGKTGRLDNHVGCVVEFPRNMVDEDPDQTCSYGLHVCSYNYLPYFAHADGHVVVCKINPKDVVAIPRDYNNTKMRVCRYEVVGEVEGWYQKRENVLSDSPFNDAYDADSDGVNKLETDWDFENLEPDGLPNLDEFAEPNRYAIEAISSWDRTTETLESADTISDGMRALQKYIGLDDYSVITLRDTFSRATLMTIHNTNVTNA